MEPQQNNAAAIKPLKWPINHLVAKWLMVRILPHETRSTMCGVYYELRTDDGQVLLSGSLDLTEEQFAHWGEDNSYLEQIVAEHLGVVII